jgi:hypothetical protein
MNLKKLYKQKGQIFTTLLFFVIIGMAIISAEAIILFTGILSGSISERGSNSYYLSESGVEEALIRMNRNPSYTGGIIELGSGEINIVVNNGTITSTSSYADTIRKIEAKTAVENGIFKIISWREI